MVVPNNAPSSVAALAASLPVSHWYQRTVSEGTKGPIAYAFARQRVTLCKDGLPGRTVWLVIKRTLGANPVYSSYMSNAPRARPYALLSGSVACVGRSSNALKKAKRNSGWTTMKCANIPAGTTIC